MSILTNVELIHRVSLFAMISPEQAQIVADAVQKRRINRGDSIVEQGQQSHALFILLAGRAKVIAADANGKSVTLAVLKPGDYLGEMSLIDDEPHSASVVADSTCDLLVLGKANFMRLLEENGNFAYTILREMVTRLRHADRKIESLSLQDVSDRVLQALIEMATPDAEDRLVIRARIARGDLAQMVGASRETVNRVIRALENQNAYIKQDDGTVVLQLPPDQLAKYIQLISINRFS